MQREVEVRERCRKSERGVGEIVTVHIERARACTSSSKRSEGKRGQ